MSNLRVIALCISAAVAAMGMAAFGRGTKMEGLKLIPAKYWVEDLSGNVLPKMYVDKDMTDDKAVGYLEAGVNSLVVADFGSPRKVIQVVVGTRNAASCEHRLDNFKIAGSNDRVNWTDLYDETQQPAEIKNNWGLGELIYVDIPADKIGSYRYVKAYNFSSPGQTGNITEFALYTDEVMIRSTQAAPWGTGVDADELAEGVKTTLKLVGAEEDATAQAEVFASQTDFGGDYAAWTAAVAEGNAVKTDFGELTNDVAVAGYITGCTKKGRWYWNAFADLGGGVRAVSDGGEFAIGSTVIHPIGYADVTDVYKIYNGVASGDNNEKDGNGWIVFDLSDLESGKHLDMLRFWPRNGIQYRTTKLVIDFGYSGSELDWGHNVTNDLQGGVATNALRRVYTVRGVPQDVVWTQNAEPIVCATYYPIPTPTAVYFHGDTVKSKPRYLRIRKDSDNFNFGEVEVRVADDPDDVVKFVHTATPSLLGTPDVQYGDGLLTPDEVTTVTMKSDTVDTGAQIYMLDGYTLSVSNKATAVVTKTDGTGTACTFTPEAGTVATLEWHWTTYGQLTARVLRVNASDDTQEVKDMPYQINDGTTSGFLDPEGSDDLIFDFGSRRMIEWFRFVPRNDGGIMYRCKDMKILVSDDRENWTTVYDQGGETPPSGWNYHTFETPVYGRYAKIKGVTLLNICECQFWTRSTILKVGRPKTWAALAFDSPMPADGVEAAVTLSFSTNNSERIVGYAATADYGDDLAAWQTHALSTSDAGQVRNGNSTTLHFAGLTKAATHYWRVFAIDANGVATASPPTIPFVANTVIYRAKAYCWNNRTDSTRPYDGNFNQGSYLDAPGWIVFDLADIPAGYRLAAMRVVTRNDYIGSLYFSYGALKLGAAEGEVDWQGTKVEGLAEGRELYQAPSMTPDGVTWGSEKDVGEYAYHYFNYLDTSMEYIFNEKFHRLNPKPRYLSYSSTSNLAIAEIELRLVKTPGLVIVVK